MAYSPIQICNAALARIGSSPILSLSDASPEAQACNGLYDLARHAVLRAFPWRFAVKTEELARIDKEPVGWSFAFAAPFDLVRVIRPYAPYIAADIPIDYELAGTEIWSNTDALTLKYIYDVEDSSLFDALFIQALTHYLAAEIAMPLSGSLELTDYHRGAFVSAMRVAQATSSSEGVTGSKDRKSIAKSRAY
jgi:hypothetical protein